ncbi:MAG: flippase-like domain-containing protein [Candidatus Competibacteraceae bacterium]|nr:flippase-like domain-containing protein [Candidatus Competibacteraceae bacterium]
MHQIRNRYARIVISLIKWAVLTLGMGYILYQWFRFDSSEMKIWHIDLVGYLPIVFFLMLLNWGLESIKWKILLHPFFDLSLTKSLIGVLSGVSVAIFTPARIGEFAGKIIHLPEGLRIKGFMASVAGNLAQWSITLIMGIASVPYLLFRFSSFISDYPAYFFYLVSFVCLLAWLSVFVILLQLPRIGKALTLWKFLRRWRADISVWKSYSVSTILWILLISFIRYLVFSFQYYLLFMAFSIQISWLDFQMLMATVFFISAFIPTFSVSEVITRGSVLVWIFQLSHSPAPAVVTVSFLIWVMNLAIPALVGYYFIARASVINQSDA